MKTKRPKYELHLMRVCSAIKSGYVSVEEALHPRKAEKAGENWFKDKVYHALTSQSSSTRVWAARSVSFYRTL